MNLLECINCKSSTNRFPTYPELFKGRDGWCMICINEENNARYKWLQDIGAFRRLRDLMNMRDAGEISLIEFEQEKKELFAL